MKKILARIALMAGLTFCVSNAAYAQLTVIDPTNLIQNTITALKAIKTEVYQDSNIAYQYQMMANQLLQATNLDPAAMKAQYDQ
ncbi:type VI secretion protein, partial [Burkholderia sp. SIMBA_057]